MKKNANGGGEGDSLSGKGDSRPPRKAKTPAVDQAKWPVFQVERWPVENLKAYDRNARVHTKKQIRQLRTSLREFGWTMPILVREDGTVIAGHGRLEAGKAEKLKEVPIIVARGWTEAQCRSYTLADNKLAENSEWDEDALNLELADLNETFGLDLSNFGFELDQQLLDGDGEEEGDPSPQLDGISHAVVVRCRDEAHQTELLEQFEKQGLKCEALIS